MNKWKALAIFFTIATVGGIQETYRICTSSAPDIANNRKELIIMCAVMMPLFIFLMIFFYRKAVNSKRY
jgi:hypothetical protein